MAINKSVYAKRLPASGLEVAKQIYVKARLRMRRAQIIKSLIYMTGLQQETRENNEVLIINESRKRNFNKQRAIGIIVKSYLAGVSELFELESV